MSKGPEIFEFNSRGLKLCARQWLPEGAPAAVVVFVHGWGDHSGRYRDVAQHLATTGIASYAFDFEGHGLSPGKRATIEKFQNLVDDLSAFTDLVKGHISKAPLYLSGYSMGGCVCATYILFHQHSVAGLVFNASALAVSRHVSTLKKNLARFLGGVVPWFPISNLTSGALMSRDPVQVAQYDQDELTYHGKINAGTGRQLLLATERIQSHLHRITIPFLVLQGTGDTLVDPEGASTAFALSPSRDKSIHLYPDALHDLFHESNREDVMAHLKGWLDERAPYRLKLT